MSVDDLAVVDGAAWLLGDGGLKLRSSGGGWQDVTPNGVTGSQIAALGASSGTQAWIAAPFASGVAALVTADGGVTWTSHPLPAAVPAGAALSVDATSATEAWVEEAIPLGTESAGTLFHTVDAGASWSNVGLPRAGVVAFVGSRGWAAVGPVHNRLYVTADLGATWTLVTLPLPAGTAGDYPVFGVPVFFGSAGRLGVTFYSPLTDAGLVAIYGSADGGITWQLTSSVPLTTSSGVPIDIAGPATWFIGDLETQAVRSTTDGGATYQTATVPGGPARIAFDDATRGYVVITDTCPPTAAKGSPCGSTRLLHTNDGLQSWQVEVP